MKNAVCSLNLLEFNFTKQLALVQVKHIYNATDASTVDLLSQATTKIQSDVLIVPLDGKDAQSVVLLEAIARRATRPICSREAETHHASNASTG